MARRLAAWIAAARRLRGKFTLLALAFALPIAILTGLLVADGRREVRVAEQERRGIEFIAELAALLHTVQAHNVAAADPAGSAQMPAAAAATDEAIARVRGAQAAHGEVFGTGERAQNLVDHWTAMKSRQARMSVERSLLEHRALSDGIVDLMYFVAERSRLLLDPAARSAYLQDVSVSRIPELVAAIGQATALMRAGNAASVAPLAMAYQLATKNLDAANRGFANAFGGSDVDVGNAEFARARTALERSANVFLEAASARVRNDAAAAPAVDGARLGTAALTDAFRLNQASLALLDGEIAARATSDRRVQAGLLTGVGASLALAATLLVLLTRGITGSAREAVALAGRIAEGDLSQRLARRSADEIGELVDSLNRMSERMGALIGGVKGSSDEVALAAREVAHANADLSSRTELQASSLEEMAASTEELSAAVTQSTGKIQQAGALVTEASQATQASHATMSRALETMRGIDASSRRIADISATIDGIAFQTNILALNAAVEAARVGEAGKGFAVVAGEVRLLSQRSATAAHEIKALIRETVAAIQSGGTLVNEAGAALASSVETIREAVVMMEDVTAMSRQQGASIDQISAAVMDMNGVTQKNAAFVQQTAGIASRQRGHAERLVQSVGGFRVAPGAAAAGPRDLRTAAERPALPRPAPA